ncbi:hypothetical protein F5Y09DRAFT_319383 [Xylaria sp. FL1042]|nr:hypothetical protein F5Y09DRAFT_319383 [Xylaria sp. FL1042]
MALEQPDFTKISHSLNELSEEFSRCVNIPAIQGGGLILAALDRIESIGRGTRDKLDAVERRLTGLETRVVAMESNAIARMMNSRVRDPHEELAPLYSVKTNTPILLFPDTIRYLEGLSDRQVTDVLSQLGQRVDGLGEAKRRERLKYTIGVVI